MTEIAYVRDRLRALGVGAVVIDSGILGEPTDREPDVSRREVAARAAGTTLDDVRAAGSRGAAVALMREGVRAVVVRLFADGRVHGVLCLGGAEGALLGAAAMQALPVGVPKLLVSPRASGRRAFGDFVGESDVSRHALGRRHPRPQRHLAADLRQRRRGDGGDGHATPGRALGDARRALRRDHDARPDDARA